MNASQLSLALCVLAGLAGCAATPAQRIERDPGTFAALSPEQQTRVRDGKVGVGFDAAAVRLAYGEPDRVIERETGDGASEVWIYYAAVAGPATAGYCVPGFPYYAMPAYCRPGLTTEYEERSRVTFKDGKVVSVERTR